MNTNITEDSLELILETLGINKNTVFLGSGNYSRAFETNRGTVLKLTTDYAYMEYLNAVQGMDNSFVPEVINNFGVVAKSEREDYDEAIELFAVELKKYVPVNARYLGRNLYDNLYQGFSMLCRLSEREFFDMSYQSLEECMAGWDWWLKVANKCSFDAFEMFDITNVIKKIEDDFDCFIDMHGANFMYDIDKNCLVITDPVGCRGGYGMGQLEISGVKSDVFSSIDLGKASEISKILGGDPTKILLANFCKSQKVEPVDKGPSKVVVNMKSRKLSHRELFKIHCHGGQISEHVDGKMKVTFDKSYEEMY